ncbi:MAG: cytochrome P450 [Acetobacteraceae bacterium]
MSPRAPVTDWDTDFDHLDPRWNADPYPIWSDLRQTCPVARTDRYLGVYFPSRYEDVRAVAYDTVHFSSRRIIVRDVRIEPPIPAPPITSDPPQHKFWKQALLPLFTAEAVAKLEPRCRALCDELIDGFIGTGGCDVADAYTRHVPVRLTAHMLGLPEEDGDLYRHWIHQLLEVGISDLSVALSTSKAMAEYFAAHIARRQAEPTDDLISAVANIRIDGAPASLLDMVGVLRLLLVAGIDTTWSAIGAALWHLAATPADRERLVAEPALMPVAIEELLRAYAPVTMAREVMKDTVVGGCPMKAGHMVLLSFPAANRDPAMFPDPDRVIIDRAENRHAAFGLGIHRCVGSNLARMEMTVAVETFLRRIPDFRMAGPVRWSEGTVRGPRSLPMVFGG